MRIPFLPNRIVRSNLNFRIVRIVRFISLPIRPIRGDRMVRDPPTTRVVAYQAGKYLRTSIPSEIVAELNLKAGDVLAWEIEERDGRKVAIIRKLE